MANLGNNFTKSDVKGDVRVSTFTKNMSWVRGWAKFIFEESKVIDP